MGLLLDTLSSIDILTGMSQDAVVRFIAPDAKIAFVEITWGLVPDLSGTQALRRLA